MCQRERSSKGSMENTTGPENAQEPESKNRKMVKGILKSALSSRINVPTARIDVTTRIPKVHVESILLEAEDILEFPIPIPTAAPSGGWKIGTLTDHICRHQ